MTAEEKKKRRELRSALIMTGAMTGMLLLPLGALGVVKALSATERRTHSCGNARSSMRSYVSAQSMYHRNDWEALCPGPGTVGILEYARPYTWLNTQLDGGGVPIQLIDTAFAGAQGWNGAPKHGYLFRDMKTIAGEEVDWTKDFALCGTPSTYGRTGYRTFIVTTDGTVWVKDLGYSDFVDDFPADPPAEGWVMAE
ncbi:MAG: DUF2950 family protein [Planctomycetota bacterium]|jgi:hypothetical protein